MQLARVIALVAGCAIVGACERRPVEPRPTWPTLDVSNIAADPAFPAVAAMVFDQEKVLAAGAAGVRKIGTHEAATIHDKWHLGSCGKAMTATLAARLVEKEKINWRDRAVTVLDVENSHPAYAEVTLGHLLAHTGRMPGDMPKTMPEVWAGLWKRQEDPRAARAELAQTLLQRAPEPPVGGYRYSNEGYALAGAMLEAAANESFEQLMRREVLEPLGMESCGFGSAANPDSVAQPWPHKLKAGKATLDFEGSWDNPTPHAPAGTIHCTLEDWSKFGRAHLGGTPGFLSADSLRELHTRHTNDYALGWNVGTRDWAGGTALSHSGSNTLNFAIIWLAPEKQRGFVIATNVGGEDVFERLDRQLAPIIDTHIRPIPAHQSR